MNSGDFFIINSIFNDGIAQLLSFTVSTVLKTLNHFFMNQFITEHRNTFSLTTTKIKDNDLVSFNPHKEWQIKDDTIY